MLSGLPDLAGDGATAIAAWAPLVGFWVALFALAALELSWPLRRDPAEARGRIGGNLAMGLINAALVGLAPVTTVAAALWAARSGIGLLNIVAEPLWGTIVVTIALRSLASYALHRLSHAWHPMWRVHRVHHADRWVDLSTGFRNHPLELVYSLAIFCGVAVVAGLHPPTLAIYEAVAAVFGLWSHANLRLGARTDRVARRIFVTPAVHLVHHSAARAETDSNFGDVLTLWDRLLGTYRAPDPARDGTIRLGLGDSEDVNATRLLRQLRRPFDAGIRR